MDRRLFHRIPAELPLRFGHYERHTPSGLSEELGIGESTNLSTNGICFESSIGVQVGRLVAIELTLPPPDATVLCHGRAVWCDEIEGGYKIGVELWWSGGEDQIAQAGIQEFVRKAGELLGEEDPFDRRGSKSDEAETVAPEVNSTNGGFVRPTFRDGKSEGEPSVVNRLIRKVGQHIEDRVSLRRALRLLALGPVGVRDWNLMREVDPDVGRLHGIVLVHLDLAGVDFREIDLSESRFAQTDLSFAHLENADLSDSDLLSVRMISAGAIGARMDRSDLRDAEMSFGYFDHARFREANLERATLARATLEQADFGKAKLARADLTDTVLTGANFARADLRGVDLRGAEIDDACFKGANLYGADLREVDLTNADQRGLDLTGVRTDDHDPARD